MNMRTWIALAALAWAGWLAPMSVAAAADMPVYTLTFKADGTFEPARLEVPAGRFKIVVALQAFAKLNSLPPRVREFHDLAVVEYVINLHDLG